MKIMKQMSQLLLLTLILTAVVLWIGAPQAECATYGELIYTVENGQVTITGCDMIAGVDLVIPETIDGCPVTAIADYAFEWRTGIGTVTIPASVTSIGVNPFNYCSYLYRITVSEDNQYYSSDEYGVLFNKDKTELIACPGNYFMGGYVIPDTVTAIRDLAFIYCTRMSYVVIPDSVVSIGRGAFYDCCSLSSVTIPTGVTEIPESAFTYCYNIQNLVIPDSVTVIGDDAFRHCGGLMYVNYGGSKTQWDRIAIGLNNESLFEATINYLQEDEPENPPILTGIAITSLPSKNRYIIGESLDTAGLVLSAAYSDGTTEEITEGFTITGFDSSTAGTKTVTVVYDDFTATFDVTVLLGGTCGDNLTWTLDDAGTLTISGTGTMKAYDEKAPWAGYKSKITAIVIEYGVTTIDGYAFRYCSNAASVTLPESVVKIGKGAFFSCSSLKAVTIPNVETIYDYTFAYCQNLRTVTIPDSVTSIGARAFYECKNTSKIVIGNGTTTIGDRAFYNCWSATKITMGTSVTDIGEYAFYYCANLKSISLPDSVKTIGRYAFYDCDKLSSVSIPRSITQIGFAAFSLCDQLTDIYYGGSASEWARISNEGGVDKLTNASIHYARRELIGIAVSQVPEKTDYQRGESVDTTGLELTLSYDDGAMEAITEGFNITGFDPTVVGRQTITVTYEGFSATFNVLVQSPDMFLIMSQPGSVEITAGFAARFCVEVTNAASYKWQYRRNENAPWVNTTLGGNKTDTLSVPAILSRNGYQYRCRITGNNGKIIYSEPATLTVLDSITVISQPMRQIVNVNANAVFTVVAEGAGLTYQWLYRKSDDDFWKQTGMDGNKTNTLTVPALVTRNGYQYMCAITDENGIKINSKVAVLSAIGFTSHPEDQAVAVNANAVFTVTAQGKNLIYQWQYRKTETGSWMTTSLPGATTDTLTVQALATRNGYQYRCRITDELGTIVYSEEATLTVQ